MSTPIVGDHDKSRRVLMVEEQLRRAAARATHQIVLRRGTGLGMWVGAGFPKSGTVWLCNLMSTALGVPYPRDYQLPVMMTSVIHGHWPFDDRMPPSIYIRRDGRDVMVSLYFYRTRALAMKKNPRRNQRVAETFHKLYGDSFDPSDVRANLPRFIEHEMTTARATHGVPWHEHVRDWWDRPGVGHVTYEDLLADTTSTLAGAIAAASGREPDIEKARLAAERHSFAATAGRKSGEENRGSFLRKGVAGDWKNQFSREAGEVFDAFAGEELVEFGYADNRKWYAEL